MRCAGAAAAAAEAEVAAAAADAAEAAAAAAVEAVEAAGRQQHEGPAGQQVQLALRWGTYKVVIITTITDAIYIARLPPCHAVGSFWAADHIY